MHLPDIHMVKLGELYDPEITSYMHLTHKGLNVVLSTEGCMIFGYLADPKPDEIAAWSGADGRAKFGWVDAGDTAFLAFQLGRSAPYMDSSFHPGHLPPEIQGLPRGDQQPRIGTLEALAATPLDMGDDGRDIRIIGATDSEISGHYQEHGGHLLINIILLNARDGRVAALHQLTWPPRFVYEVRATINRLMEQGLDADAESRAIQSMYRFSSRELYQSMSTVRCVGGEQE